MDEQACVFIMASRRNGTLCIGSTDHLVRRVCEHREGVNPGFTNKHGCKILVWYELYSALDSARVREFRMKDCQRAWKVREIEGVNPEWENLYDRIAQP